MAVNIYDQPFQAQYMNTYVPMPYQEILQAGAMKQERYDLSEELREDLDDQLMQSKYLKWSAEDAAMVKEKQEEFTNRINNKIEEVGGDYGKILPFIKAERRKYQNEMATGQLGKAADNYQRYWENYEEEKKRLKDGKINENSFKTQRAKERASYHGVGDVGALADIELEYAVLNQDIQEEVFKVADKLEEMNSNQIGEWALKVLPSGHELLERTDFKVSKLSPNTIYELANAAVRNNPELQPYLEERAGLKVWESMEEARNTPGGFEELASSALKLSEDDIIEGMEIAGYDPYSATDRENYLEYKYKEALKDSIVSDQALIASGVFAKDDRIESRETRVPSESSGSGGSSLDYVQGMILSQGNDLVSQSPEGLKMQEEVIKDTDESIEKLEEDINKQKEILKLNDNPDTRNKIEELEIQKQALSAQNEAIKNNINQLYQQAGISTEDIDNIIEDRINIYRADQMKKNNQGQRMDSPLTAIDESNQKTWEDPETGEIYYLDPIVFNQIETNANFQKISIRNQIEAERKEALEKAMEDPNFKVTKTPYLFTGADAGKGYSPIGTLNAQNSLLYKNTNGSGWSLVLNGSSDAGLAASGVVEDFINENSGAFSDGIDGYKPTGETFIYATNQVDNAGHPVYQLGVEGEKDGNTKIIKSFQVTNGAIKTPEFRNIAVSLAQSNVPKYQQLGHQMLADMRLAPHLRNINLHTMGTKEVRAIPGLKDPVTQKELKVLKDGTEYAIVYDDPEGDIKIQHDEKEATYSAFTPKAGGEEDLYIKLYDELQGTEQELSRDNLKAELSSNFWNPQEEIDTSVSVLPSQDKEGYRERVAIEALSLPKEIAPEKVEPVLEETFENINLSDSLYGPAAQPVMIDFLKELDRVFKGKNKEVELGGLFRTKAYNDSLKYSAKNSLHTVGLGADFSVKKDSSEYKTIIEYINNKNSLMKRKDRKYKIKHAYHQGHLHIELVPSK